MSDPKAAGTIPAATAAALPPLDPPGTRVLSWGLRVGPNAEFSVDDPMANSSRLVLPTTTAPAFDSRETIVASYGGRHPSRIRDEQVVGTLGVTRKTPGAFPATTIELLQTFAGQSAIAIEMYRHALKTPGLKIVFGTDAVAGAHGRNVQELIVRVVHAGQSPMDAVISATSLAAPRTCVARR